MTLTRKPQVDSFISGAKADTTEVPSVEVDSSEPVEPRKKIAGEKRTKMSFYMTPEMHMAWNEYVVDQMRNGKKKPSFQKVVEEYLLSIIDMG